MISRRSVGFVALVAAFVVLTLAASHASQLPGLSPDNAQPICVAVQQGIGQNMAQKIWSSPTGPATFSEDLNFKWNCTPANATQTVCYMCL